MTIDQGAMQGLIELLDHTFEDLGVTVSLNKLERLAVTIHNAMSAQTRIYHDLEHVFNFREPDDPIIHIAALYHDIIYFQVDKGFYTELEPLVLPYINHTDNDFFVCSTIPPEDQLVHIVLGVFGFKPGQKLAITSGLNEFLSALVMVKMLGDIVPAKELFKAAICIEATIPFRGKDADGRLHFEVLVERLSKVIKKYGFAMTPADLDAALQLAVVFSNKDVESFAEVNVARFLDITWLLLPESNISLRSRGIYTIRDYRMAIQKMEGFLSSLNPDNVFNAYKGVPPEAVFDNMRRLAHYNIATAVRYLRLKLIAMAILEAIAEFSGGDAPISLFLGDIPIVDEKVRRLEDYLPTLDIPAHIDPATDDIYKLLDIGRVSETFFDLKNSPTTLFVYKSLTQEQAKDLYTASLNLFSNEITPTQFFEHMPRPLLTSIARGCAIMAYTRREKLMQLVVNHS